MNSSIFHTENKLLEKIKSEEELDMEKYNEYANYAKEVFNKRDSRPSISLKVYEEDKIAAEKNINVFKFNTDDNYNEFGKDLDNYKRQESNEKDSTNNDTPIIFYSNNNPFIK